MAIVILKGRSRGREENDPTLQPEGKSFRATPREKAVQQSYKDAVGHLRDSTDNAAVRSALRQGDATRALDAMPWDQFVAELSGMRDSISAEVVASAKAGAVALGVGRNAINFTLLDERAIKWAERHVGKQILGLQTDDRKAVREIIRDSLKGDHTVDEAARLLRQTIGLSPRSARAVARSQERAIERAVRAGRSIGEATAAAERAGDAYGERLLASRAETIARTEIVTASNEGRFASWEIGVDSGLLEPTSTKEWIDQDGCPICAEVSGEIVAWDEEFSVGEMMPPAHPNCRCTAVLHIVRPSEGTGQSVGEADDAEIEVSE